MSDSSTTETFNRQGLILRIDLGDPHWTCTVYRQGSEAVGAGGVIESWGGANYGSLGFLLYAYVMGYDLRQLQKGKLRREYVHAHQSAEANVNANVAVAVLAEEVHCSPELRLNVNFHAEAELFEINSYTTNTKLLLPKEDIECLAAAIKAQG